MKQSDFQIALGRVMRRHRKAKKLTQRAIAPMCMTTLKLMNRIECGKSPMKLFRFALFCEVVGVLPGDVINEAYAAVHAQEKTV